LIEMDLHLLNGEEHYISTIFCGGLCVLELRLERVWALSLCA